MSRRGTVAALAALLALGVACIDLSVDPDEITSLELPPMPNASIIFGDTLRDAAGVAYPLVARVFDASGNEVTAEPTFIATDTFVTIGTGAGGSFVLAKGSAGTARVIASVGTLQSVTRQLDVVPAPDTARLTGVARDTIVFHDPATPADTTDTLAIRVVDAKGAGVKSVLVNYTIQHGGATIPVTTDTTQLFSLIDASGRGTSVDSTDTSGNASRRLRYRVTAGQGKQDSVTVTASVLGYRGKPVRGSPVTFVVVLRPAP